jgi:CheY-like chemotaxis protein
MNAVRILVADDDEALRTATSQVLQDEGYDVVTARDGVELLREYRQRQADLVLCDLFMPGKDGIQVIGDLLRDFPRAKIIAMSGGGYNGMINVLHMARHLGAKEIVSKPFKRAALLTVIQQVLASDS